MKQQLSSLFPNKHLTPLLLRIGLATMFFYAAISSTLDPREWVGYLPSFMTTAIDANILLKLFSIYELALGVMLLSGLLVRYMALLAAATLIGITVFNFSLFAISFRDIGLAFAALALAFSPTKTE